MMVIGAFNHVQQSLRWLVDHFSKIAEWRATLLRVMALRDALSEESETPDGPSAGPARIALVDHAAGHLGLENLSVALGDGRAALDHARIEFAPGERILIVGEMGLDKGMLFRAMAGLWPWGTGTIHLPPRQSMMFMPHRPYLSLGSLHAAVSYPGEPERFTSAAASAALVRVGLDHLVPSLDREERWDKKLSLDEQQRLAFARLLLHQPRWVLLDDAMGALEDEHRREMLSIFDHELTDAAVISIGRSAAHDGFYTRTLQFYRQTDGAAPVRLRPRRPAPPVPAIAPAPRRRVG
jgi:putative ATP-binding cassette transporter